MRISVLALFCFAAGSLFAGSVQAAGAESFYAASFQLPDGNTLNMSSLRGRPLIVSFLERDCAECMTQLHEMAKAEKAQRSAGLRTLAILIDKRAESLGEPTAPFDSPITTAITDFRKGLWLMQNFGNPARMPFTLVFDAQGKAIRSGNQILTAAELGAAIATSGR